MQNVDFSSIARNLCIEGGNARMRDLKHLIYFENLLQQANNDLVQDACKDGRLALA